MLLSSPYPETATPVAPPASQAARLRAMVDQHFDRVWRTLRRLGVDPASVDDAAQETFLVASRKLAVIDLGGEGRYLTGIALRVAADFRRARRRRREDEDEGAAGRRADPSPLPDALLERKRAREQLDRVMGRMTTSLRTVFVLVELEGMSLPEVAQLLGVPLGTATSRLRRARESFHALVLALDEDGGPR